MRKRSFRPTFDSLDLRIAPSNAVAYSIVGVSTDTPGEPVNGSTGLPASLYGGGSPGEPVNGSTGLPASLYGANPDDSGGSASNSAGN